MGKIITEKNMLSFNNTECRIYCYKISPAIVMQFSKLQSKDTADGAYSGGNQFRIDFTRIGRFECEFMDHTFSYRGENEITLLATGDDPNWAVNASIPTSLYQGCALIIYLSKLSASDNMLLETFGINIREIAKIVNKDKHWKKIVGVERLNGLFEDIYNAHSDRNSEIVCLRAMELLVFITQNDLYGIPTGGKGGFFPAQQIHTVKTIRAYLLSHYAQNVSFEALVLGYDISYTVFNRIFKTIYGESPYQYLKKIRMNIAAQRLLESEMSTLEIASSVGYSNPSKFSSAFQSVIGVLPSTFRKRKTEWSI